MPQRPGSTLWRSLSPGGQRCPRAAHRRRERRGFCTDAGCSMSPGTACCPHLRSGALMASRRFLFPLPAGALLLGVLLLAVPVGAAPKDSRAGGAKAAPAPGASGGLIRHQGPCNASTALPIGEGLFVMVDNKAGPAVTVRLYRGGSEGGALGQGVIPAQAVAPLAAGDQALDLEASTRIGPLVYWIASHGAARGEKGAGEPRPNRRRLIATNLGLRASDGGRTISLSIEPVGRAYSTLIEDLAADPRYSRFHLPEAASRPDKARGGLSIEGLAATPGGALLIGFRNPTPGGRALLVPLTNPNGVLAGEKALFADPVLLDLGGLGVRSMELVRGSLLIVAGASEGSPQKGQENGPVLYRWSGQFDSPAQRLRSLQRQGEGFNPEALFADGDTLVLLSDDGKHRLAGKDSPACDDLPAARQSFREWRISPLP